MTTEKRIIKTVKQVMPAVVTIVIRKSLEEVKKDIEEDRKNNHSPISDVVSIPKDKVDSRGMVQVDGGSGFIVNKKGIVLTNKHVISEPRGEYTVITNDDEEYVAELLARDPVDDIAILKINPKKSLPYLKLGKSSNLSLGQTVLAFGNALGIFKNTVSFGIVSGLLRSITAYPNPHGAGQEMRGLIQTDAAINPGNSGGPLTDIYGRVIGINAAIISDAENISLAIPSDAVVRDLRDLKKYKKIRRPLLGFHFLPISKDLSEKLHLSVSSGAIVLREHPVQKAVVPKSPADVAGIIENDIIISWNGKPLSVDRNILDFLELSEVGNVVTLTILRDGKEIKKEVTLGERK